MTTLRFSILLAGFVWVEAAGGQDVDSGPENGKKVPALKVFDATGPKQAKEVDYAAERKDKTSSGLFRT